VFFEFLRRNSRRSERSIAILTFEEPTVGIFLVVIVVLVLIVVAIRAEKSYEKELRRSSGTPSGIEAVDELLLPDPAGSSGHSSGGHSSHPGDAGCGDAHHGGCDVGGHGAFDGGGHH
jgi:hypothetical protein